MIQDIHPHTYHNEFTPALIEENALILSYDKKSVLIRQDGNSFTLPAASDFSGWKADNFIWLFAIDDRQFFLARRTLPAPEGYAYVPIRYMRYAAPRHLAFASVTGLSLAGWYRHHQLCGCCGQPLQHSKKERMLYCPSCGIMNYPRINPAVIVAVRHENKLLVSTYAGREYTNMALIAGFAEIGETIEETVHREVMEEVGICVKNLQFYKSQPWCFTDTLLFGFFCDLDGEDTLRVDHEELATARWINRDAVPEDVEKVSLTMEMMTLFKEGKV